MTKRRVLFAAVGVVVFWFAWRRIHTPAAPRQSADPAAAPADAFNPASFGLYGYDSGSFGPEGLGAIISQLQSIQSGWTPPPAPNPVAPITNPAPAGPRLAPPIGRPPGITKPAGLPVATGGTVQVRN